MKTIDCFYVPAYVRVDSEEGPYEAQRGYNVIAKTDEGDGYFGQYLYTGEGLPDYVTDPQRPEFN